MSEWNNFVGNLAAFFTVVLYSSGSQICAKIYQTGKVGDISALPFLTAFFNAALGIYYGILAHNQKILFVGAIYLITSFELFYTFIYNLNFTLIKVGSIGLTLEVTYIFIYLRYTLHKKVLLHKFAFLVVLISIISYYVCIIENLSEKAFYFIGYLSSLVAIVMFGSPLSSISAVFQTRSTESLSFPLCFANFATASLWTLYGAMLDDNFILVPNIIGSILGMAQLALFTKFPSQTIQTIMKGKAEEFLL